MQFGSNTAQCRLLVEHRTHRESDSHKTNLKLKSARVERTPTMKNERTRFEMNRFSLEI